MGIILVNRENNLSKENLSYTFYANGLPGFITIYIVYLIGKILMSQCRQDALGTFVEDLLDGGP